MKVLLSFVLLYIILIGSIFNFYIDGLSSYKKNLTSTQNKLVGLEYLELLKEMSFATIRYYGHNEKKEKEIARESILTTIKKIDIYQELYPMLKDVALNEYLKDIAELKIDYKYYDFLDYLNHENYRVGNICEILFSQEKERYFLGTLMTHYLPEFYISLGVSHNILLHFIEDNYLSESDKNIYLEQKKLIYLSSREVDNIIGLLGEYKDSEVLYNISKKMQDKLKRLKKEGNNNIVILNYNVSSFDLDTKIMHELVDLQEKLDNENAKLLSNLLKDDEKYLCDKITSYKILLSFLILLVTAIFIYFFRIFNNNIKKDKELEKLNSSLIQTIKEEVDKNREKDKQMIHQSRLAQMGEMISMIAHQWRQPLAAISSTSAGINLKAKLETLDNKTAIELSDKIIEFSLHLSSTIDDFRNFFKTNKDKSEISYDEVVSSVLAIIEVSITNKNIELIIDLNCDDKFYSYPSELKQVVLNLIKNSEDILLDKKIETPYIKISTFREANSIVLSVSDNAGGVPQDIIEKIFDPYFSTKTKKDGTGLGLYMSKTIIQDHCEGSLSVSNDENGAVFKITLNNI